MKGREERHGFHPLDHGPTKPFLLNARSKSRVWYKVTFQTLQTPSTMRSLSSWEPWPVGHPYRGVGGQSPMEAGHSAEHLLTVAVQLLQLVLDQHSIQGLALLDEVLPEHDELVDLVGV